LYGDYIGQWLENCLDYGITEADFWNMTFAELNRLLNSKRRMLKIQKREKAIFDYTLADLIGRSVARLYDSTATIPSMSTAYPSLFTEEEETEQIKARQVELSALRFKHFAQSHNKKMEVSKKE
jgi:hypothetical protein